MKIKKIKPFTYIIIAIICIAIIFLLQKLLTKRINFYDPYPKEKDGEQYIEFILQDKIIEYKDPPIYENNEILLPLDMIKQYIDPNIAWEAKTKKIIIATKNANVNMKANNSTAYVNNEKIKLNVNPKFVGDVVYMPIEFLKDVYGIEITYNEKNKILIIDYINTIKKVVTIKMENIKIYEETNKNSKIATTLSNLTTVTNFDENQKDSIVANGERWYHVVTQDGIEGYIKVPKGGLYIYDEMNQNSRVVWRANPVDILWGFEEYDNWCKVRTLEGRIGYIEKSKIKINAYKDGTYVETISPTITNSTDKQDQILVKQQSETSTNYGKMTMNTNELKKVAKGKLNVTWHYVGKNTDVSHLSAIDGLDVISPTFFDLADDQGNVDSRATIEYVKWAKNNGYKVWAMLKNDFEGRGSTTEVQRRALSSEILNDSEKRERTIKQVLAYANLYKIDGINLDFENLYESDKDAYSQFVREFYPLAKEQGLILSVDVGIPNGSDYYSLCYDRVALSETVDYVMVMTYDQHWAASSISGSVAQYEWVENGIIATLKEVPAKKLLLGLPFYVRQWVEKVTKNDEGEIISREKVNTIVLTMNEAKNTIKENNAEMIWDETSGQYYAEFEANGYLNRIWLEDENSINQKASLVHKYGLAGTSAWSYGYERQQVWATLKTVLKECLNYNDWIATNKVN